MAAIAFAMAVMFMSDSICDPFEHQNFARLCYPVFLISMALPDDVVLSHSLIQFKSNPNTIELIVHLKRNFDIVCATL